MVTIPSLQRERPNLTETLGGDSYSLNIIALTTTTIGIAEQYESIVKLVVVPSIYRFVLLACTCHLLLFSPQEEQESATIQVQSLLARAEELVPALI